MDPRGAVRRLLELHSDGDVDIDVLDEHLDDTAIEILTALCNTLAFALAAARTRSHRQYQAREQITACLSGIEMVLEVWEAAEVEVVGGAVIDAGADYLLCD